MVWGGGHFQAWMEEKEGKGHFQACFIAPGVLNEQAFSWTNHKQPGHQVCSPDL